MTWTRLGDDDNDRPDHLSVSRSARLLNHEGKVYCNKHTTDGYLPAAALLRITDSLDPNADVAELVAAGVWAETDTGWQLDWSDQETAEDVKARQEFNAAKQKRYRQRKAKHERGDHSECDPRFCKAAVTSLVTSNGDGNVTGLVTPSLPVPSRPKDRGQGQGAGARSAGATRGRAHQWVDDGSGVTCKDCGLPATNQRHQGSEELPHTFTPDEDGYCTFRFLEDGEWAECQGDKSDTWHAEQEEAAS